MSAPRVRLITPPAVEPISLAEAKEHCRVDGNDLDANFMALIAAARESIEELTRRALVTRTVDYYLDRFDGTKIELPLPPLQSVESIVYLDENGSEQTLPASAYRVHLVDEPGIVALEPYEVWPTTYPVRDAIRIRAVIGYGDDPADVPQKLRLAMLFHIQAHHDNDPQTYQTLMRTRDSLISGQVVHYV